MKNIDNLLDLQFDLEIHITVGIIITHYSKGMRGIRRGDPGTWTPHDPDELDYNVYIKTTNCNGDIIKNWHRVYNIKNHQDIIEDFIFTYIDKKQSDFYYED